MQMVTGNLRITGPEPAATHLGTRLAHVLHIGWLVLQAGMLVLVLVTTPLLHTHLQTITPNQLGDISLAQPNAASAAALARLGVPLQAYASVMVTVEWGYMLLWVALGGIIIGTRSRDPVGVAFAFLAVQLGSSIFLRMLHATYANLWLPFLLNDVVQTAALVVFFSVFPDGRWVPHWIRWVAAVLIGSTALATIGSAVRGTPSAADISLPVGAVVWPIVLGAQLYRYRRVSSLAQRQQTKWLLVGIAMFLLNLTVAVTFLLLGLAASYQWLTFVLCYGASLAMVTAFGFAILHYQLFDVDLVINRMLVYSGLTLSLIGLYALIVAGLGAFFQAQGDAVIAFLAAATTAVLFQPLHQRLQRTIDRLLYGERSDPYRVIAWLGQRLEAAFAPSDILPTLVQTVSESLNLPYVAITLGPDATAPVAAATGSGTPPCIRFPLTYQGTIVGHLLASPRRGEMQLSPTDARLLTELAQHAGAAVHGVCLMAHLRGLTTDLQRSREQLVLAREEERRRLRRDLHDDLAPTLAGLAITAGTITTLIPRDPAKASTLAHDLQTEIRDAVRNIRRLVYDLRPPTLDEWGLLAAIRERAAQYSGADLDITVDAPTTLPALPAAVEVAAYRIVQEALMNVVKHAHAQHCTIRLALANTLLLEVRDDGVGVSTTHAVGVGLQSMRERATELGGTCLVESLPDHGTRVMVHLPFVTEAAHE
jgi:signal transduction histidine kinase